MGCVVNYTCHVTTNPGTGSEASANWVYYMEKVIRGAMGAEVPVVFLQGAAGNVTQVDNLSLYKYPRKTPMGRIRRWTGRRRGGEGSSDHGAGESGAAQCPVDSTADQTAGSQSLNT